MTRLQVKLKFLNVKSKEGSDTGRLKADACDENASQLGSIEISLDGKTVFASEDTLLNGEGTGLRINEYFLKPKDVTFDVVIDRISELSHAVETQTAKGENSVQKFPDEKCEDEKESGEEKTTTENDALESVKQQATDTLRPDADVAAILAAAECAGNDKGTGPDSRASLESYSFPLATLMAKCRERKQDAEIQTTTKAKKEIALQTTPRYLIRFGAPVKTIDKMPLAWPPMTNYKCAILFVELKEAKDLEATKFTRYVALMDGDDNVGIALEEDSRTENLEPLDSVLIWWLANIDDWLMRRPLIMIAASSPSYISSISQIARGYRSIESYIDANLAFYKNQIHICRKPIVAQIFKSLLFCN